MRILHTADLHLCENHPERFDALEEIITNAKDHTVDLVTIGGDLFDSDEDAQILRPKIRKLIDTSKLEFLAIPGNHDRTSFTSNLYFGSKFKVAKAPFQRITKENVVITAVPYTEYPTEELLFNLRRKKSKTIQILLLHCTLDIGFSTKDFGEEEQLLYFPISAQTLSKLNYDYILAGHFHKETISQRLENGGVFIYPGSPVSHSKKECGQRHAVIIDTESQAYDYIPLKTFFFDRYDLNFQPGKEEAALKDLMKWVKKRAKLNCQLIITARGFIKLDETKLARKLKRIGDNLDIDHQYRDIRHVLEHPLFTRFKKLLNRLEDIENKEGLEGRAIEAISRLIASGEMS